MANEEYDDGRSTDKPADTHGGLMQELRDRFRLCVGINSENMREAQEDLRFLAGKQWPEQIEAQRILERRPCLTFNKLPTFIHQVTNDIRQNTPGIIISPADSNADPDTAKVIQGLVRHIEYSSNADIAYDTAGGSAAAVGFGYFRLVTEYCDEDSFDQDIRFRRIRNPMTVYMDPAIESPDGSDQKFCIITSKMPKTEFQLMYPNAEASRMDFSRFTGDAEFSDWLWADYVRIAEYYRVEERVEKLYQMPGGARAFASDLEKDGVKIDQSWKSRDSIIRKVMWYKMTALDVLEEVEIKCKWIPVFPVFGDEIDIDGKVIYSGLVRHARDPMRMYNFWMTNATEEVALRPKTPYIGAEGQFEGHEEEWDTANIVSYSKLEYKPVTLEGSLAPPPQRQPMADVPVGMLQMAIHASDNIKATTGLFDSSIGAAGIARSGIQERQQQRQGDTANFHYSDNLSRSVRHAGRCIVDMIPHYYDATRVVRIMGEDGKIGHAEVNKPLDQPVKDGNGDATKTVLNDLKVGKYDVTIKAGPSYDTLRQEAVEGMVEVAGKWPKLMDVAGDLVVQNLDWPGASQLAARLRKTIPQELRAEEFDPNSPMVQTSKGPLPVEQAGEVIAMLEKQVSDYETALSEAESGITKAKITAESTLAKTDRDNETKIAIAQIAAEAKKDTEELKGMVALLIQKMQPPPELASETSSDMKKD